MITAAEARVFANRRQSVDLVMGTYEKEIRTVSANGGFELKVYHDSVIRIHKLNHMNQPQQEDLFREVAKKLEVLGFEVKAYSNKLMVSWSA